MGILARISFGEVVTEDDAVDEGSDSGEGSVDSDQGVTDDDEEDEECVSDSDESEEF